MALVLKDRVKETTTTEGTGTYTLAGAVTGFEAFSAVGDGNTTYYCCTDGTEFEVGIGTYTASGTTLARTTILQSSNSDAAVNWTSGTRNIFVTQPAEKAVFLNADGDIEFDNTHRIKIISDTSDPVLAIAGGGPNFIRFHDATGFTSTTNAVDIVYRTTPNDLSIEKASDGGKIAEFGGDDGHAALYYDNAKKLETTADGVEIISTDDGSTESPKLSLYRNSATPADNDEAGAVIFNGENDAGEKIEYARIDTKTADVTDGSEDGRFAIDVMTSGTSAGYYIASFDQNQFYKNVYLGTNTDIVFEGDNYTANETTLTVTDPTGDRTITLPDATGTVQLTDGSGASLTSLNASELGSGTVPNARLDAQLQDVAGLAVTDGNFIVGDGSNFVAESGATARTSLGLGTAAVLDTGISNTNVPKFTSGVADDDFLRVNGTDIEGRSASEVLSDIGAQASLTFGISNTNAVKIDSASVADDEYARFTANGLESRATSEVLSDIAAMPLAGGTFSDDVTFTGDNYNVVWDKSDDALEFTDNAKAKFGAGDDLQIYHNGSNSIIHDAGTGNLVVRTTEANFKNAAGTEFTAKFIQDGAVELYHDNAKKLETTADGVEISSTDDGAGNEPILSLYRHSGSPADADHAGTIQFNFQNDADQKTLGGRIYSEVDDVSDGSEDAAIKIAGLRGGSEQEYLELAFGLVRITGDSLFLSSGKTIQFEGSTNDTNETTLTVTDPTADRTITLPDATGTVALQNQTINAQTGTTYTTVLSDAAQLVTLNNASAITLTIPPNSSVAYAVGTRIDFIQIGAGQVTVAGGTGVTVNSTPTLKLRAQHSAASCIKIATDTWQLVGDLAET